MTIHQTLQLRQHAISFLIFASFLYLKPRHKKGKRFDKKAGVEFRLMYRDHRDPLYYDPGASGRILVPTTDKEALPQEK